MKYRVLIEQDENGVFVAEVPSLPGCVTQGSTRSEALANAQEAIAGYLESLRAHDEPIPTQDTIVDEVRRGREEHAARFDYDLAQIYADLKRTEQERCREDSPLMEPPKLSDAAANLSLQRARFARR